MQKNDYPSPVFLAHVNDLLDAPPAELSRGVYQTSKLAGLGAAADRAKAYDSIEPKLYPIFSKLTGGFLPGGFTVFCGATGTGKTTFLANLACDFAANKIPYFVASVEIGQGNFAAKMISIFTNSNVPDNFASLEEQEAFEAQVIKHLGFRDAPFSIRDSRVNHRHLLADIFMAHKEHGIKIALLDNLHYMMEVVDEQKQIAEMDRVIHDLVVFAKRTGVHLLMVLHPRKTQSGRVETEFDIKGSSTAVQEAGLVLLWNRLEKPEHTPIGENSNWCRELKIAKIRYRGRSAGKRIIFSMKDISEMLIEHGEV